jgi:peptidoglycan-associated lipoprotein
MGGATRSALSAFGRLAIVVALAGCAGMPWQSPTSSTEPPPPATAATPPAEPSVVTTPAAPPAPLVETAKPALSDNGFTDHGELADLRFRSGQLAVVKADHPKLDAVVRWLKQHPDAVLLVEGHTDDLGTYEGNLAAAARRAESVRSYLIARGVDPGRVTIASVGPDRPVCTEKTDTCRARNRRAHFLVRQP